jgi:hypothetical protein
LVDVRGRVCHSGKEGIECFLGANGGIAVRDSVPGVVCEIFRIFSRWVAKALGITVLVVGLVPILLFCCLLGFTILMSDEVGVMPWWLLPRGCPPDCAGVNLSTERFIGEDFSGANLSGANLSAAKLTWADMSGADLRETNLSGARLNEANLSKADLSHANLSGTDLTFVVAQDADFRHADLSNANLDGSQLQGANFLGAVVTDEQLEAAYSLKNATMPDGTVRSE